MDKKLFDRNGKLIAYLKIGSYRDEIRSANGALLGFFDKKINQTRSVNGKLVGFGNLLTTLI